MKPDMKPVEQEPMETSSLPNVTVVLPVRNEANGIAQCLAAIFAQDYPADRLEILLVDGESDDGTRAVVESLPEHERVRVLNNPRRQQAFAMNIGIAAAQGDYIVRVDGHAIIAPDYVRQCVLALQSTGAANVGGPMIPVGSTPVGKAVAIATRSRFGVPSAFHVSDQPQYVDTVYLGAWPRHILEEVGSFDGRLVNNQDYELNVRIREHGGKIYLSPAIRSHYTPRSSFRALIRQYYRYGVAKTYTLRLHPRSLRLRQTAPPVLVAALALGVVLAPFSRVAALALAALVAVYLAAVLIFSAGNARHAGHGVWWRLPLVFMSLHLAWGVGFWRGLLRRMPTANHRVSPGGSR
jgi:succinoglycan biosynthesis protein ExoA